MTKLDSIIVTAMQNGFTLEYIPDCEYLTKKANTRRRWMVKRSQRPFCAEDGLHAWFGPTPTTAFSRAKKALKL